MRRHSIICVLLIATTLTIYGPVIHFDFVAFDDPAYVTANEYVRRGLTTSGLVWALTTEHYGNWHPVTWLSHMLDCQTFGVRPAGHHATNVLLHALNALLVYGVLHTMTRAVWPSAFVAALFAVHPLNVESVAWIAERKNVLSTLLGLLSMWAYVAYARRGGAGRYLVTAAFLALGLMAKAMLVTLPFVFLLLDYWPLDRIRLGHTTGPNDRLFSEDLASNGHTAPRRSVAYVLREKIPLLALAAAASVVMLIVQRDAMEPARSVPLHARAANALVSYTRYMGKMLWPTDLAVLYPHPDLPGGTPWSGWQVASAGLLLLAISLLVIRMRRRRYVTVGWLWYLGTLVPVIGLVQVGEHAITDRHTYVPLVGLFIVCAWGAADLVSRWESGRRIARSVAALLATSVLTACMAQSRAQARHWRDSVALFTHTLEAGYESPVIHTNLGNALKSQGELDRALAHYRRALELAPGYILALNNLGIAARERGDLDTAVIYYRKALRSSPDHVPTRYNLANALGDQGKVDEAIGHYRRAVEINPEFVAAQYNLANALEARGERDAAIAHYQRALQTKPDYAEVQLRLGRIFYAMGRVDAALAYFHDAHRSDPESSMPLVNLAWILTAHPDASVRDTTRAIRFAERAARLTTYQDARVLDALAAAYAAAGRSDDAATTAQKALDLAVRAGDRQAQRGIRKRLERYTRE